MVDYKYLRFRELLLVLRGKPILEVERDLEPFNDPGKKPGVETQQLKVYYWSYLSQLLQRQALMVEPVPLLLSCFAWLDHIMACP